MSANRRDLPEDLVERPDLVSIHSRYSKESDISHGLTPNDDEVSQYLMVCQCFFHGTRTAVLIHLCIPEGAQCYRSVTQAQWFSDHGQSVVAPPSFQTIWFIYIQKLLLILATDGPSW